MHIEFVWYPRSSFAGPRSSKMAGICFSTGINPVLRHHSRCYSALKRNTITWPWTKLKIASPKRFFFRARRRWSSSLSSPAECQDSSVQRSAKQPLVLVAGKFDAFHRGHRALVKTAATHGHPTLLAFTGMAEALRWPPRAPVVAPVERTRILREWGFELSCSIGWRHLRFEDVRTMAPDQFLDFVQQQLGASAIVCGTDWRFGYKAEGDVPMLLRLAVERDLKAFVVDPVRYQEEPVSSTRIRDALADGNVELAAELMDRPHRLVGYVSSLTKASVVCMEFVNQVPGEGMYSALIRVIGAAQPVRSFVRVEYPNIADGKSGLPVVTIYDATQIYCEDCEVYIDFSARVK